MVLDDLSLIDPKISYNINTTPHPCKIDKDLGNNVLISTNKLNTNK